MKRVFASSVSLRKTSRFSQASSICASPPTLPPNGASCEKIDAERNQMAPSPWPSPPKQGRGKEKIRVSSLAPIGGGGARRAGEGVARIFPHRQAARSDESRGERFGGNVSRLGSLALLLALLLLSSCVVG